MANKVSFASLKLKVYSEVKTFDFEGQQIEVKQYLPMSDKCDLIAITLQKAEENGIYNAGLLDMFFHLHIAYMYTNLSFTDKQKEDEFKIYDALKSNGVLDLILANMDENEYNDLIAFMNEIKYDTLTYKNTAGAVLQSLINDLPRNAEAAKRILDTFDKEKYQEVINFVKASNGGRNV